MKFVTRKSENVPFTIAEETQGGKFSLVLLLAPIPHEFEEAILRIDSSSILVIHAKSVLEKEKVRPYPPQDKNRVELDESSSNVV